MFECDIYLDIAPVSRYDVHFVLHLSLVSDSRNAALCVFPPAELFELHCTYVHLSLATKRKYALTVLCTHESKRMNNKPFITVAASLTQ